MSMHAQIVQEEGLKAGYLVNFLEFVKWDQSQHKGHRIGVFKAEGVADKIRAISLARANAPKNRQISVVSFNQPKDISHVDLLFVPRGEHQHWADVVELSERQSFILIGEDTGFLETGGVIQFVTVNNRLRFKINSKQAEKIGVSMSSKLLNLAVEVRR